MIRRLKEIFPFLSTKSLQNSEVKSHITSNLIPEMRNSTEIGVKIGAKLDQEKLIQHKSLSAHGQDFIFIDSIGNHQFEHYKNHQKISKSILTKLESDEIFLHFLNAVFIEFIESGKAELQITTNDQTNALANEQRSLEWLKTTLTVYKNALTNLEREKDLVLEYSLYKTVDNQSTDTVYLFKSYNLFWQMRFLKNGMLRISFYNDQKEDQKPSLQGDFYHLKNPIWDEFIKLIEALSNSTQKKFEAISWS